MQNSDIQVASGRAYSFFAFQYLLGKVRSLDFQDCFEAYRSRFSDDDLGRSNFIGDTKKMVLFFNDEVSLEHDGGAKSDRAYLARCKSFIRSSETGYSGLGKVVDDVIATEGYVLDKVDEALAAEIMLIKL